MITVTREQWKTHCGKMLQIQQAFSYVQGSLQASKLIKVKRTDLMQIDSEDQESSIWDFAVNFYRESFGSARGQKVMQQILDETLFLLQQ